MNLGSSLLGLALGILGALIIAAYTKINARMREGRPFTMGGGLYGLRRHGEHVLRVGTSVRGPTRLAHSLAADSGVAPCACWRC